MKWKKKEKQEKAKGKRQKAKKKNHNQPKKPSGRAMAAADEEPIQAPSPEERGGAAVGEDTAGGNTGLEETAIEVEIETKTEALLQLRKDKSSR